MGSEVHGRRAHHPHHHHHHHHQRADRDDRKPQEQREEKDPTLGKQAPPLPQQAPPPGAPASESSGSDGAGLSGIGSAASRSPFGGASGGPDGAWMGSNYVPMPMPMDPSSSAAANSLGGTSPAGPVASGQLGDWIKQAIAILEAHGVPASKMDPGAISMIIQHESGGNPNAQNNWDSNAAAGHPSIGLMQTIQPTFDQYKLPGMNDIRNPVDNIVAGVQYAIARYGSVSNVPGVVAVRNGGKYVGY